ncbi:MAG: hypothetical protein HQK53_00235 [Oligoflexia bacterium]|nr:hypothetical protein [Oligoflexia bacterium]
MNEKSENNEKLAQHGRLLKEECDRLKKSRQYLDRSYEKCGKVVKRRVIDDYQEDELEKMEALCARFARTTDIIIQKILPLIEYLNLNTRKGSVRDLINMGEKLELISDANNFVEIRLLRNSIAHEYAEENLIALFDEIMRRTPEVLSTVDKIDTYIKRTVV